MVILRLKRSNVSKTTPQILDWIGIGMSLGKSAEGTKCPMKLITFPISSIPKPLYIFSRCILGVLDVVVT
jgi:hypothetical protein